MSTHGGLSCAFSKRKKSGWNRKSSNRVFGGIALLGLSIYAHAGPVWGQRRQHCHLGGGAHPAHRGKIRHGAGVWAKKQTLSESSRDISSSEGESSQSASSDESSQTSQASSSGGDVSSLPAEASSVPVQDGNKISIREIQFGPSGDKYDNFYFKNNAGAKVDVLGLLAQQPDIHIKKDGQPQVLIMHTHTCESYLREDLGYYPADFYPRTTDNGYNVSKVGDAIAEKLEAAGIGVVHDYTQHDNPSYNGSYGRSEATINKNLQQYPSIQVVLDVHRDALGSNESSKVKPTFIANGKKAAQIMIVSGYNNSANKFPDWEYNMRFALKLQQAAENRYPGMTRPMNFTSMQYNMYLTHGSLLIEVGTDANTLDEAVYSGSLLGDVLSDVLNTLTE